MSARPARPSLRHRLLQAAGLAVLIWLLLRLFTSYDQAVNQQFQQVRHARPTHSAVIQ